MVLFLAAGASAQLPPTRLAERLIEGPNHEYLRLIDQVVAAHVPLRAAQDAFDFYDRFHLSSRNFKYFQLTPIPKNSNILGFVDHVVEGVFPTIANQRFLIIFDLNLHSSVKRLHVIDLQTGAVESVQAAHGKESDCGGRRAGFACKFISERESQASPLGFFVTGQLYNAIEGPALRLNGLEAPSLGFLGNDEPSTIIIHGAAYVTPGHTGLSWGCPAMDSPVLERLKDKIANGALFYFYHSSLNYKGRNPIVR
jgi:hypothetical protein